MDYYLFNIGWPYNQEWWNRTRKLGIITTGFENSVGDRGEKILTNLEEGDCVIAYASGWGAVGVGLVGLASTYRLLKRKELPADYESTHRHFRNVDWVCCIKKIDDAVPFHELKLANNRTQTKTGLAEKNARRIIGLIEKASGQEFIAAGDADWLGPAYQPTDEDSRKVVERQIRERRGQQQFRNALRKRYGPQCMVTGCDVFAILEAAHIKPYRAKNDHNPENGLLLRADIHTLFDLNLLGIEPKTLKVELHPALRQTYGALVGNLLCKPHCAPAQSALSIRYAEFEKRRKLPL